MSDADSFFATFWATLQASLITMLVDFIMGLFTSVLPA
jgi:hypothetical protein